MIEIGVDIGGTFTDVVAIRDRRRLRAVKIPTTHGRLLEGVVRGLERVLSTVGARPAEVTRFVHGTTVATNAVLEGKGHPVGLLTTEGFEDVLEIGRQKRSRMYDLFHDAETPAFLAPGRLRVGVRERVGGDGRVLVPLDEEQLQSAVDCLVTVRGVRAIGVCFINSFRNPAHELRARELIQAAHPDVHVSCSAELDPVFREYERTCVTAFDAYVRPIVASYLDRFLDDLRAAGVSAKPLIMLSRGSVASVEAARQRPVSMLFSGLAAGVIGGAFAGKRAGHGDVITIDIGGTSCDVALVRDGVAQTSREGKIREFPLRMPMVDVTTIGAGGGSIAWIDAAGGLRVGPHSAGSVPGPACFGNGGVEPTVTDAGLVLGYLNPDNFAGGEMKLDARAAEAAVARLAEPLRMGVVAAAEGIHTVINSQMAQAVRLVTVLRGFDPRRFALVVFGGGGPMHGVALARALAIPLVVVPPSPGALSALGLLISNLEWDQVRTVMMRGDELDLARIRAVFEAMDRIGLGQLRRDGVPVGSVRTLRYADVRYVGQSYELEVALDSGLSHGTFVKATRDFHARHEAVYRHANPDRPVEFVNLKTVHVFPLRPLLLGGRGRLARTVPRPVARRAAIFGGRVRNVPIYAREVLAPGQRFPGPAIVEQADTTVVVQPRDRVVVDASGSLIIHVAGGGP